jgi:CubicO group peptidase (beta-lactamase class C family)
MVARRGKLVHFETYGTSDAEAGRPMTADTIVRLYSMTKPIASVALMTLYEEGKFQLDDPAARFIPEFKGLKVFAGGSADQYETRDPEREMTVRDLLMHTSGLVGSGIVADPTMVVSQLYGRAELRGSASGGTLAEMVKKLGELPLQVDPGSRWIYGISTDLVGYLCEVIGGMPFDRFLQERIFDPLGMVDTGFHVPPEKIGRFAANYRPGAAGEPSYVVIDRPDESSIYARPRTYFSGAGGLVGAAADYMRFCKMLANGGELDGARILGTRTLQYMAMNHLPGGSDLTGMGARLGETTLYGIGFGLGFAVLLDPTVAQIIGTPGEFYWGGAASTAFFVSPKEELIMVFLTQLMPSSTYPFRRELRATIYGSIVD